MVWDKEKQNSNMLEYFKKLIRIRKENKALIYGDYNELYCRDNIIIFERNYSNENMLIIINNNCKNKSFINKYPVSGIDVMSGEAFKNTDKFIIDGKSIKIIKLLKDESNR